MGRPFHAVLSWLPALVLVTATLAVAVNLSRSETSDPMDEVFPLDVGTTWVYDVLDHDKASGTRIRQVLGPGQIIAGEGLAEVVRLSSVYDAYPGQGAKADQIYVGVEGDQLLQYGVITRTATIDVVPPAPAYQLPAEVGSSWSYDGMVGSSPFKFETEVTDHGEVEVGGHTFRDCTEWTSVIQIPGQGKESTTSEVLEEWTCPGVGTVRLTDTYEAGGVLVIEELREFNSPDSTWTADEVSRTGADATGAAGTTFTGFDQARSYGVPDGDLSRALAWTEARDATSRLGAVSDDETMVLGETDGLVTARDVGTGELRWQVTLPQPIVAAPVIAGEIVMVADGLKNLWALSMGDGSARWVRQFDDVVSTVPVAVDDLVVVAVEDGSLHGLRVADGDEAWTAQLAGIARTMPALHDDVLVVGDDSGALSGIETATGETSWSAAVQDGLEQGPTVAGDRVLAVDANGVITAYDVADGTVDWQARGDFPVAPLAVGSDTVVSIGNDSRVEAFDLSDGSRRWSVKVADMASTPAVIGDEIVLLGDDARVTVLSLTAGAVVDAWDLPLPSAFGSVTVQRRPALVHEALVFSVSTISGDFGTLSFAYPVAARSVAPEGVRLDLQRRLFVYPAASPPVQDGTHTYQLDIDGALYRNTGAESPGQVADQVSPPFGFAAGDGVVVVPVGEEVQAIDGADGSQLWAFPAGASQPGSMPAIADGVVYVPLPGLGLIGLELRSGDLSWTTTLTGSTGSSSPLPLPGGDLAYAANGLARFDGRSGTERWRLNDLVSGDDLRGAVAYSPLGYDGDNLYAILVSPDATQPTGERTRVVAVEAETGRLRWQRDLDGSEVGIGPAAGSGVVVVIDGNATATGLDARTGEPRWTFRLGTVAAGAPVVHDGVVALVERGRPEDLLQREFRVVYLDAESGVFVGAYEPPNGNDSIQATVGSTPDGTLLVPATDDIGQVVLMLEALR